MSALLASSLEKQRPYRTGQGSYLQKCPIFQMLKKDILEIIAALENYTIPLACPCLMLDHTTIQHGNSNSK